MIVRLHLKEQQQYKSKMILWSNEKFRFVKQGNPVFLVSD